jgi:gas vesicle protein
LFFSGEEQREKLQELKEETKISVDKVIKEIEDREEQIRPKQE